MEIGSLELIGAWASIIVATLGGMFVAFKFLHDTVDKKFEKVDERFDAVHGEIKELRDDVTDLKVSVARIEGRLGIGFPTPADDTAERVA